MNSIRGSAQIIREIQDDRMVALVQVNHISVVVHCVLSSKRGNVTNSTATNFDLQQSNVSFSSKATIEMFLFLFSFHFFSVADYALLRGQSLELELGSLRTEWCSSGSALWWRVRIHRLRCWGYWRCSRICRAITRQRHIRCPGSCSVRHVDLFRREFTL